MVHLLCEKMEELMNYADGYTYHRDSDVLLAKITPRIENGNIN